MREGLALQTAPPRDYVDPAHYAREVESVFRRGWIAVARCDQLASPGDYLTLDLLGEPLVAVRGDDGAIRVLSRVCRHRWMPVVADGRGHRRSFQCPYHLWTYALDGRLVGAPDMEKTPGFDRSRCGLPSLRVETWMGWVFTSFDPDAAPLAPQLAGLERAVAPYRPEALRTLEPLVFEHEWNWKVLVENFLESYHHQGAHRETLQPVVPASGTWAEDVDGPFAVLHNPTRDGVPLPPIFATTPGLDAAQLAEFVVGAVFPLHLFTVQPDSMLWYRIEPLAVDRIRLSIHPCVPAAAFEDPAHAPARDALRGLADAIHREDIVVCDGVQRGVRAHFAQAGPLSHLEKPLAQLRTWLERSLGAAS